MTGLSASALAQSGKTFIAYFLPIPVSGPLSTTARGWRLSGPRDVKNGLAYDPTKDFVRYTNGVLNYWNKMERPGVLLQDGM
jgi:hypothetical protein